MNFFKTALTLLLITCSRLGADDSPKPNPISAEERLSRVEGQIAVLLEEVRALRQELQGGSPPRGPGGSFAIAEKMVPGCSVKTYVRTGGADPSTPPTSKMTPSDEREDTGKSFNAQVQRAAAGYGNETVTVIWDGFVRITENGIYEFIFTDGVGHVRIGDQVISRAETTTRLELPPGYHPIQVLDYRSPSIIFANPASFSIKRSGFDPLPMTPGTLWMPETQ